ncbi:hypothetical protein [Deinococcus hopiensis]|uniref:hypothetical protein n=1 Tax=Deinococcus hopiensis TaxID=309885 RepID=UPI001BB0866E|nr:hypothetical protein [Deinococcus hopiensis]
MLELEGQDIGDAEYWLDVEFTLPGVRTGGTLRTGWDLRAFLPSSRDTAPQ